MGLTDPSQILRSATDNGIAGVARIVFQLWKSALIYYIEHASITFLILRCSQTSDPGDHFSDQYLHSPPTQLRLPCAAANSLRVLLLRFRALCHSLPESQYLAQASISLI